MHPAAEALRRLLMKGQGDDPLGAIQADPMPAYSAQGGRPDPQLIATLSALAKKYPELMQQVLGGETDEATPDVLARILSGGR